MVSEGGGASKFPAPMVTEGKFQAPMVSEGGGAPKFPAPMVTEGGGAPKFPAPMVSEGGGAPKFPAPMVSEGGGASKFAASVLTSPSFSATSVMMGESVGGNARKRRFRNGVFTPPRFELAGDGAVAERLDPLKAVP